MRLNVCPMCGGGKTSVEGSDNVFNKSTKKDHNGGGGCSELFRTLGLLKWKNREKRRRSTTESQDRTKRRLDRYKKRRQSASSRGSGEFYFVCFLKRKVESLPLCKNNSRFWFFVLNTFQFVLSYFI